MLVHCVMGYAGVHAPHAYNSLTPCYVCVCVCTKDMQLDIDGREGIANISTSVLRYGHAADIAATATSGSMYGL